MGIGLSLIVYPLLLNWWTTIFYKTLSLGYKFSQVWPKKEPYLQMFEQTKVIKLTDLAFTVAPAIAVATLWLQLDLLGMSYLNLSLAMALMVLSIPAHGYFQLGKQANSRLPIGLQGWYRELEQKVQVENRERFEIVKGQNQQASRINSKLTFMDLAILLNAIFVTQPKRK